MSWLTVGLPAVIAGVAGIAGSLVQRKFQLADDERRRAAQREDEKRQRQELAEEQMAERRRLSDAASLRLLHRTLQDLRHQFESIAPGIRNGVASENVFTPEAEFYKASEQFRHAAMGVWILDDDLRDKLDRLLQTVGEFLNETHNLGVTKYFGPDGAGGRREFVQQVTQYSENQRALLTHLLDAFRDFVKVMTERVGLSDIL
ncbi:hypothetical protein [Sulfobacillus harzensis]|uniref:Uncharacterized protein n=1 Tax=Sulfobacillus harzensis TaxID=2729629 RepID=A0A7Y0L6P3_9FIRM|nr:hypothetical protein [Sulfobacillus harzensis]NMP23741.1 hypothetical protein [Sulfobacillus harzensis]